MAEFCNGFTAMPSLLPFDQNSAIPQRQAEGIELTADAVIGSSVNNLQVGMPALSSLRKANSRQNGHPPS